MAPDTHRTPHFLEELDQLKQRLRAMGLLARDRVRLAVQALVDRDASLTTTVIDGDVEIDQCQVDIDDRALKLLALYQPMAVDLRSILAVVKINTDLERVGDLAVNMAEATQRYLSHPPVTIPDTIPRMAELAQAMLRDALHSLVSGSVPTAQSVLDRDDDLDHMNMQVIRELLTSMRADMHTIAPALNVILIARHLERVGDHATNIAEDVIFIVAGRDVRHLGGARR